MKKFAVYTLIVLSFYYTISAHLTIASPEHNDNNLDDILRRVDETNKKTTSIKADITITRLIPLLESEEISKGKLSYQKPKMFHIKFLPPRNEVNIINGNNIWIYHIDLKQVEKYTMDEMANNAQIGSFLDFGLDESIKIIQDQYDISLVNNEKNLYQLNLKPKEGMSRGQYSNINLWIDERLWIPVIFELHESGGEIINRIELKKVVTNKNIDAGKFEFITPKDVVEVEPFN